MEERLPAVLDLLARAVVPIVSRSGARLLRQQPRLRFDFLLKKPNGRGFVGLIDELAKPLACDHRERSEDSQPYPIICDLLQNFSCESGGQIIEGRNEIRIHQEVEISFVVCAPREKFNEVSLGANEFF